MHTGGATTLAIDQEALDDASQTNTALRTVDEFAGQMAAAELFSELPGKCELEVVLTNTGDLQMLFCATSTEHAQFCMDKSEVCCKEKTTTFFIADVSVSFPRSWLVLLEWRQAPVPRRLTMSLQPLPLR